MKIINKNEYNIMYGMEFINAGEVKDVDDKTAKLLLNHPNVEKFVAVEEAKKLEDENAALKKELELAKAKEKAVKLGIKFNPKIGLEKLLAKIKEAETKEK